MLLLSSEYPPPPRPLYARLSLSRSGVGLSLLGCVLLGGAYTPVGESIQPVRSKARAGVALDVSGLQQFIDQAIAFAPARIHAYAECRSSHHHVWGGVPKDLHSHVLQHPKGLLAHLPNTLLHQGRCCAPYSHLQRRQQVDPLYPVPGEEYDHILAGIALVYVAEQDAPFVCA